ncbi:MAG: hypothetical protein ACP5PT_05270, partial [Brevinematia bacterium]
YRSFTKPLLEGKKILNFLDLEFMGVVNYSVDKNLLVFQDILTNTNVFYVVLPVSNGVFIYDNVELNILPTLSITKTFTSNLNSFSNTNLSLITNNLTLIEVKTNISDETNKLILDEEKSIDEYDKNFSEILNKYFLKGYYSIALEKFYELRDSVNTLEEREMIDIYISRCYYAMNKKRKSIYILLRIKSDNVKPIADFWLNRFSKYFFGEF